MLQAIRSSFGHGCVMRCAPSVFACGLMLSFGCAEPCDVDDYLRTRAGSGAVICPHLMDPLTNLTDAQCLIESQDGGIDVIQVVQHRGIDSIIKTIYVQTSGRDRSMTYYEGSESGVIVETLCREFGVRDGGGPEVWPG